MGIITLSTDFGYKDPFAAEMKGVILSINPEAVIVDISHDIGPQDIDAAAYVIGSSFRYFPSGSIHVVVVDPGVGSSRRPVMLESGGHFFVGPDNGVFSGVLAGQAAPCCIHITEEKYMLSRESATFQGRDLFAPAAAWLSRGITLSEFGPSINDFITRPVASTRFAEGGLRGEIIYIDHFGNLITNIRADDIASHGCPCSVRFKGQDIRQVRYYAEADEGSLFCLINSSGYLELFVNKGNAAIEYSIKKGDDVIVSTVNA